jgi:hypothetical protein
MINKKVLIYWMACSFSLVLGIHYLDGVLEIDDWPGYLHGVFWGVLLLLVISIVLAVIMASFPFRSNKTPSKKEIGAFLPSSTVSLTIIAFLAFILSRPSYATPAAEPSLCQRVREGNFPLDDYLIERKGSLQTETDRTTKEKWAYNVKWFDDCECEMTNVEDTSDVTKVKIINVTNDAYECVANANGRITKHKILMVRGGN